MGNGQLAITKSRIFLYKIVTNVKNEISNSQETISNYKF